MEPVNTPTEAQSSLLTHVSTPPDTARQDGDADGDVGASPWVIRIELDKDKVAAKRVQLEDLQRIIVDVFGQGTFQIIISDQNMPRQVRALVVVV